MPARTIPSASLSLRFDCITNAHVLKPAGATNFEAMMLHLRLAGLVLTREDYHILKTFLIGRLASGHRYRISPAEEIQGLYLKEGLLFNQLQPIVNNYCGQGDSVL